MTGQTQPTWRRACVGGDCDTVYPRTTHKGRTGRVVILERITGDDLAALAHRPAAHEVAAFIPDDMHEHLG
jgi:hypothetical protein